MKTLYTVLLILLILKACLKINFSEGTHIAVLTEIRSNSVNTQSSGMVAYTFMITFIMIRK